MSTEPVPYRSRGTHRTKTVARTKQASEIVAEMLEMVAVAVDLRTAPSPLTGPSPGCLLIAIDDCRRPIVVTAPQTTAHKPGEETRDLQASHRDQAAKSIPQVPQGDEIPRHEDLAFSRLASSRTFRSTCFIAPPSTIAIIACVACSRTSRGPLGLRTNAHLNLSRTPLGAEKRFMFYS